MRRTSSEAPTAFVDGNCARCCEADARAGGGGAYRDGARLRGITGFFGSLRRA